MKEVKVYANAPVVSHYLTIKDQHFCFVAIISDGWDMMPDYGSDDSQKNVYARPLATCTIHMDGLNIVRLSTSVESFLCEDQKTLFNSFFTKEYMGGLVTDALDELNSILVEHHAPTNSSMEREDAYGILLHASDVDELIADVDGEAWEATWDSPTYYLQRELARKASE